MPKGSQKSRSLRRVFVRTPGAQVKLHYRKRKPGKARCGSCGVVLAGVSRERNYKMQKMSKTKKRPSRPFGGVLCTRCTRLEIIRKNR